MLAWTTILLLSQINFLMFPSVEIMEFKLRAEIWVLNCMLSLELTYVSCSFDILWEPFCFLLTARSSRTSTKKYSFHIWFQIFLGFPGNLVVESLKNVL